MDYVQQQGWVLIAFRNALWQLLHAANLEEGVVDTIRRGGDTDTNAAICGALLGAVYGREAIPAQWLDCLLNCRPEAGHLGVQRPRPECFWPVDALDLANRLISEKTRKREVNMPKKTGSHHVVPNANGGWDVKKSGASRSSGHFDKKQDAIDAGRKISRNQGTEFYIHGKDGKIQNKDSHGNDSYPPKG